MADATKTTAGPIGHMTYTQAPAMCEKSIFHLFHFTQSVKNYSSSLKRNSVVHILDVKLSLATSLAYKIRSKGHKT